MAIRVLGWRLGASVEGFSLGSEFMATRTRKSSGFIGKDSDLRIWSLGNLGFG